MNMLDGKTRFVLLAVMLILSITLIQCGATEAPPEPTSVEAPTAEPTEAAVETGKTLMGRR
jgi:hypothetical protein